MNCREGKQLYFAYVLPQPNGQPIVLVVPLSLQMGWLERSPFFCAATETSHDVATQYCKTPVGSLPNHKFMNYVTGNNTFHTFDDIEGGTIPHPLQYFLKVYVDNFMAIVIPTTNKQMLHVAKATVQGIYNCFPANGNDDNDPILLSKMKKGESSLSTWKTLLGFDFDGTDKILWLKEDKQHKLLIILYKWLCSSKQSNMGIPFDEFQSISAKIHHAFTGIPAGNGLSSRVMLF
jgi:hypothetical protein